MISRRVLGPDWAQQPPLHAALPSLPAVGRRAEGHELGPGTEVGVGVLVLGGGRSPIWRPGTHTLVAAYPVLTEAGAGGSQEEEGAGSKQFTALWG